MSYESKIPERIKKINETVAKALIAVGTEIQNEAQVQCPVDNGKLRQDINYDVDTKNNKVLVGNNLEYAIYVNKGTGIYAEDGNGRKDEWVYQNKAKKKWYKTKGQKPQPYLKNALKRSNKRVIKISEKILSEIDD